MQSVFPVVVLFVWPGITDERQGFQVELKLANIEDSDKLWFGRWLRRYAVLLRQPETELLQISQNGVKQFCRALLAREVPT